jgi:chromosome segregation ATPase
MSATSAAATRPQDIEMTPVSGAPEQLQQEQHSSGCSPFACTATISGSGVAAAIVTVAAAAIAAATHSLIPVYIAIVGGCASGTIHVGQGIATCRQKTKKTFEQNVDRAGKEVATVSSEVTELQKRVLELQKINVELQAGLEKERETGRGLQKQVAAKVIELHDLTERLEAVNKRFGEAQGLLQSWADGTAAVSRQLASLKPENLESDVEGITRQMQQLALSKDAFTSQVEKLGADAAVIGGTQAAWSGMLEQLQSTIHGLATDVVQKRELLATAQKENQKLSETVQSLQKAIDSLGSESAGYQRERDELMETNAQLQQLRVLLERPDIAQLLQKALAPQGTAPSGEAQPPSSQDVLKGLTPSSLQ